MFKRAPSGRRRPIVHRIHDPALTVENRFYRRQQLVEDFCLYDVTCCPERRASCTKSAEDSKLAMIIFDLGDSVRMRRVASSPLRFGIPRSSTIRSGCSSSALWTASNPSEASATTSKPGCLLSIEQIASRNLAKSSTTKTRTTDTLNDSRLPYEALIFFELPLCIATLHIALPSLTGRFVRLW